MHNEIREYQRNYNEIKEEEILGVAREKSLISCKGIISKQKTSQKWKLGDSGPILSKF